MNVHTFITETTKELHKPVEELKEYDTYESQYEADRQQRMEEAYNRLEAQFRMMRAMVDDAADELQVIAKEFKRV